MSNDVEHISINNGNLLGLNAVTEKIVNSHCIVCGKAFARERIGKLYCSAKCKQYAHNHRERINQKLLEKNKGITQVPLSFDLEEYSFYNRIQKKLKRLNELKRKHAQWEAADQELCIKERLSVDVSRYTVDTYASKKLTESENMEFSELEFELDKRYGFFDLKELSIEQWSFIRSLQPNLDKYSFLKFVNALGWDFIDQLSFKETSADSNLLIRNKFVNHCNMVALGQVKFQPKKPRNVT